MGNACSKKSKGQSQSTDFWPAHHVYLSTPWVGSQSGGLAGREFRHRKERHKNESREKQSQGLPRNPGSRSAPQTEQYVLPDTIDRSPLGISAGTFDLTEQCSTPPQHNSRTTAPITAHHQWHQSYQSAGTCMSQGTLSPGTSNSETLISAPSTGGGPLSHMFPGKPLSAEPSKTSSAATTPLLRETRRGIAQFHNGSVPGQSQSSADAVSSNLRGKQSSAVLNQPYHHRTVSETAIVVDPTANRGSEIQRASHHDKGVSTGEPSSSRTAQTPRREAQSAPKSETRTHSDPNKQSISGENRQGTVGSSKSCQRTRLMSTAHSQPQKPERHTKPGENC